MSDSARDPIRFAVGDEVVYRNGERATIVGIIERYQVSRPEGGWIAIDGANLERYRPPCQSIETKSENKS